LLRIAKSARELCKTVSDIDLAAIKHTYRPQTIERKFMPNRVASFHPTQTDWNLIRSFVAVVEHKSLTKAAEFLGLSQATLSRQINELETVIGAALFERVARGLKLTVAGENLVDPARQMMNAARALGNNAAMKSDSLAGSVRITASETVSAFVLPSILARMATYYPEIQVELVASNQLTNLLEREADIAIRMVQPTQSSLIARHIGDWEMGMYVHESYFNTLPEEIMKAKVIDMTILNQLRWIGMDQSDSLIAGFRGGGFNVDRHFFAFRSDNQLVNWQACLSGIGISFMHCWIADKIPGLVRILRDQKIPWLPIWLTSHRELNANRRIRAVFDFLAQEFEEIDRINKQPKGHDHEHHTRTTRRPDARGRERRPH
jgi:DNA-binding transcriptional LysR family regulator